MNPVPLFLIIVSLPLLLGGCGEKGDVPVTSLKYKIRGDGITITGCDENALGKLIIPAAIEGKSVTSIGNEAFRDCRFLTKITIPDSVTSIGERAFQICRSLTSITIPDSVTSIGERAFEGCRRLTSITIPDSVTSIGGGAFWVCTGLTAVTFLGDAPKAGQHVFLGTSPTIYRKPEAKGWGDKWSDKPVKLISEKP